MRKKRHGKLVVFLALVAVLAVLIYDSNTRLVTEDFTLRSMRVPQSFDGFRIVHLSDLHETEFGANNCDLISAVADADPDIIAITGDLVDKEGTESYVATLALELVNIAPVYYVSGNHEWASGWTLDLFELLENCGVHVLRNEYEILTRGDDQIVIAGIDDPNGPYDQKTPEELVEEIRMAEGNKYILMLAHRNTELDTWSSLGVDAVLCGHAHGGVIRLPFTDGLVAPGQGLFPTWTDGIYTKDDTQMLVSRGLANARGIPRFLNNPEVVCANLAHG